MVVYDSRFRNPNGLQTRNVRFDFQHFFTRDHLAIHAVLPTPPEDIFQPWDFLLMESDDDLSA